MSPNERPEPAEETSAEERPRAGNDRFTDADLEPTAAEKRAQWRRRLDWLATGVALAVTGLWAGEIVAIRWGAAPAMAERLPAGLAELVSAATLQRTDQIALALGAVVLGAEVARTAASTGRAQSALARVRRILAVCAAGLAAICALVVTPQMVALIASGALTTAGPVGAELVALGRRGAELRLAQLVLLGLVFLLHLATLPHRMDEVDDDDAVAPAPPGPR
jgi:hypothetical protein